MQSSNVGDLVSKIVPGAMYQLCPSLVRLKRIYERSTYPEVRQHEKAHAWLSAL